MSDIEDMLAFIHAQLDDDERVARAVKPLRRVAVMGGPMDEQLSVSRLVPAPEDGMYQATADRDAQVHFARHDPARVLREVGAKRRLVDSIAASSLPLTTRTAEFALARMVLRLLALPYSDRPGYRAEWRQ